MISEKIKLLGANYYKNIPGELTLKAMPTISELDMVGAEDFTEVMLDKILPESIEEKINCREFLEIDYDWVCRALRMLNYGPYHTTNIIFCNKCDTTSRGEYSVDLRTVPCKMLPPDFDGKLKISRSEFIDYAGDVVLKLPTIQDILNARKDKLFDVNGRTNMELARICYMTTSIAGKGNLTPIEVRNEIESKMTPADYIILKGRVNELADYGIRAGGTCLCPKCHKEANFLVFTDDRFFRPTLGDLRRWADDKRQRTSEDVSRDTSTNV